MASDPAWLLVVEPDLIVRHPLAEYLRECGYKVLEAADGDEAVTLLTDAKVQVDLMLCDIHTPGSFDGFALSRWVRENAPQTKVILAGTTEAAAKRAGELCEDGPELRKPYDHQLLLDRIKRLLAARDRNQPR